MAEPVSLGELGADELLPETELAQGGQDSREEDSASQAGAQSQGHHVLSVQTWTKLSPPPSLSFCIWEMTTTSNHHLVSLLGTLEQDETVRKQARGKQRSQDSNHICRVPRPMF